MPIQKGDVPETWADTSLLTHLTDFNLKTEVREGISKFIDWYRDFYKKIICYKNYFIFFLTEIALIIKYIIYIYK